MEPKSFHKEEGMRHAMYLVPLALALSVSVAAAETVIGIGTFGGVGIPNGGNWKTAKESKAGLNMGYRIPMAFGSLSLEPFMDRTEGKPDAVYVGSLDGFDITSYGVNLGIGKLVRNKGGLHLTPFGGVMMTKARRELGPGQDKVGFQGGLQIGLHGSETAHWDLRGSWMTMGKLAAEPKHRNYIMISLGLTCVVAPR
jgi:hypothetical protein